MKNAYTTLTNLFTALHAKHKGTRFAEEAQHVLDSLAFAENSEDELDAAVAVYNALFLFKWSPNRFMFSSEELDKAVEDTKQELNKFINPHVKEDYLQFEDCVCPECGEHTGMYVFGREHDKEINNSTVYEHMYGSRLCDGCWQNLFGSQEE